MTDPSELVPASIWSRAAGHCYRLYAPVGVIFTGIDEETRALMFERAGQILVIIIRTSSGLARCLTRAV